MSWQVLKQVGAVCAAGAAFVLAGMLLTPAHAGYDQEGRLSGSSSVDGSYSRLAGNGFSANSGQCVIYAALSTSFNASGTGLRQIQSGLTRCNNATIDGTCPDGQTFVERYNGSSYYCTTGYSFTNNTQYDATTYRNSATSTTFTGHINGVTLTQAGFVLSDDTNAITWGEVTGGTTCPSPSRGTFYTWKKYDTSAGWTYVTGSSAYHNESGIPAAPCWAISATDSSGGYDVD